MPFAARSPSYTDAVRFLGTTDEPIVKAAGQLAGLIIASVIVSSLRTVDFFTLRDSRVRRRPKLERVGFPLPRGLQPHDASSKR
jgi:hypothetical protein